MARRRNSRPLAPRPSVPNPRPHLLDAVLAFVRAARSIPGVLRIALLGSLATDKPIPKDADVLVTIDAAMDLDPLARLGRRLQGSAQTVNLGADIFVADAAGRYLGRICQRYLGGQRDGGRGGPEGRGRVLRSDRRSVHLHERTFRGPRAWQICAAECQLVMPQGDA